MFAQWLFSTVLVASTLSTGSGDWANISAMPQPRVLFTLHPGCGATLFAMGGWTYHDELYPENTVVVYDIKTDSWTDGAPPMYAPRFLFPAATLNGVIYVFGGADCNGLTWEPIAHVDSHDCTKGIWSKAGKLPEPLASASAVTVPAAGSLGPGIVIAGGVSSTKGDLSISLNVYHFNGNNVYTPLPALNTGRGAGSLVSVVSAAGLLLVSYGGMGDLRNWSATSSVEMCEWSTGCAWKAGASTPVGTMVAGGVSMGSLVFTIGGVDSKLSVLGNVNVLNASATTSRWVPAKALPQHWGGGGAATYDNSIFVCGGSTTNGQHSVFEASCLKFTP